MREDIFDGVEYILLECPPIPKPLFVVSIVGDEGEVFDSFNFQEYRPAYELAVDLRVRYDVRLYK